MKVVGFIPAAPLLVPQVAGGSADVDEELRDACRVVARQLIAQSDRVIVVAASATAGEWDDTSTWGFEGFGVERRPADDRPRLPWQLGIGAWLLDDVGWTGACRYLAADEAITVDAGDRMLLVGDGSARRTEKAPGHLDDRAAAYDAEIASAIAAGDIATLGNLDQGLSAELMCAGAPVWRSVMPALVGAEVVEAELLVDAAPYGVGYFVGWWRLAQRH